MTGLVLANLGFVHITDGARWVWLAPLALLTLFAPWLVRFQRSAVHRLAWNGAVIAVFGLLVHHALSRGVGHLLEDGLLLAALCQVHLLNNLDAQKPDLLFFNSFLIAVVASFLSLSLGFSLAFLAYAPLLLLSMQLLVLVQAGTERPLRWVLRDVARRSVLLLGATLALFLLLPRDFHRKGLLGDRLPFPSPARLLEVDFTDEVSLGRSGRAHFSDRVVLRARLLRGAAASVPAHWRGATLDAFDGREWRPSPGRSVVERPFWRPQDERRWVRAADEGGPCLEVEVPGGEAARLFLPIEAAEVQLAPPLSIEEAGPIADLTFRVARPATARAGFGYTAILLDAPPRPAGGGKHPVDPEWIRLEAGAAPRSARTLARAIRGRLPPDAPQGRIVEEIRRNLMTTRRYLPPGDGGGAKDLVEFFDEGSGGHCEVFASALAVMLRSLAIPCRLVTGYRSTEWDLDTQTLTVRARHAHAWVEVLDPERGWTTVDPTPDSGPAGAGEGIGLLDRIRSGAWSVWERFLAFNGDSRKRMLRTIRNLPPWAYASLLAPFALLAARRLLQRRRRTPAAVRAYRRALRTLRLELRPGETPRELVRRAALDEAGLRALESATAAHEAARYGGALPIDGAAAGPRM